MAFFSKRLTHPRLQLLVLMLVLGVGLLPKDSMAQNPPANPAPGTPPNPGNAGGGAGDPNGPIKPAALKCWDRKCEFSAHCLKKPAEPEATETNCPSGFCYHDITNVPKERYVKVIRRCAEDREVNCIQKEPGGNCYKLNQNESLDTDIFAFHNSNYQKCVVSFPSRGTLKASPSARAIGEVKVKETGAGTREICLCDKDLCNDKEDKWLGPYPSGSRPTGGKQLGYNVALVGALLVAALPLRTMILVG